MAGTRPAFPNIGWDPTPGDVEDTRELAKKLGSLASDLGTAVKELERIECGAWKGKTAIAFTEYIGEDVTPLIRKSFESFDKASRALHRWSNELKDFQDEANRLEKSAGTKLDERADAEAKADGKGSKELGEASSAVDGVIQKVHDLEERFKQAAADRQGAGQGRRHRPQRARLLGQARQGHSRRLGRHRRLAERTRGSDQGDR